MSAASEPGLVSALPIIIIAIVTVDGTGVTITTTAAAGRRGPYQSLEEIMDKNRIIGTAKVVKGEVKQEVGKALGNTKLRSKGTVDKIEGRIQNAIGRFKDTLKGK